MSNIDEAFATFRDEAADLLDELETALLTLEQDPTASEHVDAAFRALHTIKGSGGMLGLTTVVELAHAVENLFDRVRSGKQAVSSDLVEVALHSRDELIRLLDEGPQAQPGPAFRGILERVASLAPPDEPGPVGGDPDPGAGEARAPAPREKPCCYQITYSPAPDTFLNGTNPLSILKQISELGRAVIMGTAMDVPPLSEIDPERCYYSWEMVLCSDAGRNAIEDVFVFEGEDAHVAIEPVDAGESVGKIVQATRLGELLQRRGLITEDQVVEFIDGQAPIGEALVAAGYVSRQEVDQSLKEQALRRGTSGVAKEPASRSIKVPTEKLDELVDLVGEFVSAGSALELLGANSEDPQLRSMAERFDGLIRSLRELSTDLHLVPILTLFTPFRRVVRDLAAQLGKQAALEVDGGETELDKDVVQALRDPLTHLIRNAVDHGVEGPAEREQAGKPNEGRIMLRARQAGGRVIIEVEDDGAGLNHEAVLTKARERGLVAADEVLDHDQIADLIFQPGFSTAQATTDISGRGVGMDVVRRNVQQVGGTVRIGSGAGGGTLVTLSVPLTMAIVDGVLALVGGDHYFVSIASLLEFLDAQDVGANETRGVIDLRGSVLPYVDLRDFLGLPRPTDDHPQVMVVSVNDERLGLIVDDVEDSYQGVVKPLGTVFRMLEGISGAVLLGDGTPALLLDIDQLARVAHVDRLRRTTGKQA